MLPYTIPENSKNYAGWILHTGRIGHGKQIHILLFHKEYNYGPICGSGECSVGTRRTYRSKITNDPVSCNRCKKHLSEFGINESLEPIKISE